jgi:hypothetical protein
MSNSGIPIVSDVAHAVGALAKNPIVGAAATVVAGVYGGPAGAAAARTALASANGAPLGAALTQGALAYGAGMAMQGLNTPAGAEGAGAPAGQAVVDGASIDAAGNTVADATAGGMSAPPVPGTDGVTMAQNAAGGAGGAVGGGGGATTPSPSGQFPLGSAIKQLGNTLGVNGQVAGTVGQAALGINDVNAADQASAQQQEGAHQAQTTYQKYLDPYSATGVAANQQLSEGLKQGGQFNRPFTMADAQNSEAMKTALAKGSEIIQGSAAGKGGLLSSNTLAGLSDYGQKTGAQYEQQAFDQYTTQNQNAMGGLQNLSGAGLSAGGTAAAGVGNAQIAAGTSAGQGTIAANKALNTGVNNAISTWKALGSPTPGAATPGAATPNTTPMASADPNASSPVTNNTPVVDGASVGPNGVIAPDTYPMASAAPDSIALETMGPPDALQNFNTAFDNVW